MVTEFSISCVGDIAPIRRARDYLLDDIALSRQRIEALFSDADLVFANLETPVANTRAAREDKKYVFKTSPDVLRVFPDKMVFSLANNHVLDYGAAGLFETMAALRERGLRFTGAGRNLQEAGTPVLIDCPNRRIGFLACADSRYQAASVESPGVFPASPAFVCPAIRKLRQSADTVYVSIHLGMEYMPLPTPAMRRLAASCHSAGAHVVFFHHAHCVSGYTCGDGTITLWGVGNYLFPESPGYPYKPWFETAVWHISHPSPPDGGPRLNASPHIIDADGMPHRATADRGASIMDRIEALSIAINTNRQLFWLRLRYMLSIGYIKVLVANYGDLVRRRGFAHMIRQVCSSISTLFLDQK